MLAPSYTIKGIWAAIIAGVIALLLALNIAQAVNTYADIRFNLPFGAHLGFEGWKPKAERIEREFATYKADVTKASDANHAAQAKLIADQKAKFDASAEKANATYETELANARSAADRYKLTHRVHAGTASVGTGATAPQADLAEPVAVAPADAELVTITGPDIDACTVDATYAKAAYDWAQDLVSKGAAEFTPAP